MSHFTNDPDPLGHAEDDGVPTCPECGKPMEWEPGYPDSRGEPGLDPRWFCADCGIDDRNRSEK